MPMDFRECFQFMISRWTDELVVTSAGTSSFIWWDLTHERDRVFYLEASMSLTSMFAAGLSIGVPDKRIWVFSGDGAFAMNPGMLMVEHQMNLPNITHFLVSNHVYGSTEQVPLVDEGRPDYCQVAQGFGIKRTFRFDNLDDFKRDFDQVVGQPGPTFCVLELIQPDEPIPAAPVEGPELKYRFGRYVEQAAGVKVFDN